MTERLDKFLSHNAFGSRKDIRKLVGMKLVSVNGETVTDFSAKIDTTRDVIVVDGKTVEPQRFTYLMLNKPANHVSVKTEGSHATVFDLLADNYQTPYFAEHLHCIGRLDVDTEGLLILTTDGKLTHRITSPKTHSPKKYFVRLAKPVDSKTQQQYAKEFSEGVHIEAEGKEPAADCKPAKITFVSSDASASKSPAASGTSSNSATECFLTITEGKYHQVKRMFQAVGNEVVYLQRVAIGALELDKSLAIGNYREMTLDEVELLEK